MLPDDTHFITDEASLRALHHQPMLRATGKVLRALDKHCRRIISSTHRSMLLDGGNGQTALAELGNQLKNLVIFGNQHADPGAAGAVTL